MRNKKGNFFSDNTAILLKCLGIAVLFFILTKLSKNYTSNISYKINYTAIPENKIPSKPLIDKLDITVNTSGFNLLSSEIFRNNEINIPLENFQNKNVILTNENLPYINGLLKNGYEAIRVHPDTIPLYFSPKASKVVDVKLLSEISFESQFDAVEDIIIKPRTVNISGAENALKDINSWPTDTLKLSKLKKTIEGKISLKDPGQLKLEIQPKEVNYLQVVEEYTEAVVSAPVKVINQPANTDIIIFPKKVELRYNVGLSNYEKSLKNPYEIVADFKDINLNEHKTIDLKLINAPYFIKKHKIHPKTVEFIVYNKN